jgi:hypothetical protein
MRTVILYRMIRESLKSLRYGGAICVSYCIERFSDSVISQWKIISMSFPLKIIVGYPDSAIYSRISYRICIRYVCGCDSRVIRSRYSSWRIGVSWQLWYIPIYPRYALDTSMIFFKVFWWIWSRICPRYFSDTSLSDIYIMSFMLL